MASGQPIPGLPPASDGEYSGHALIIFTAIFIPVQIICVALRYLARWVIKGPWGFDDILVFISLLLQLILAGISIGAVNYAGVGYHISYLENNSPEIIPVWGKYLVAISMIYFGGVNIPKLAILALYRRLFPGKGIRTLIHIMMAILVGLTISTVVTACVACIPFSANWNVTLPGARCINKEAFFIWGSIPNILTDIAILVLPMRVVWNLHTTTRLKIGLTITFAVGSFGLITSIVRFTTFFKNNSFIDGTWSAVDLIIWTQIETGVYLISACLPTWRPLLERIGRGRFVGRLKTSKGTVQSKGYVLNGTAKSSSGMRVPLTGGSSTRPGGASVYGFHQIGEPMAGNGKGKGGSDPRIFVTTNIHVGKEDDFREEV